MHTRRKRHSFSFPAPIILLFAAMTPLSVLFGCLPAPRADQGGPAPTVNADAPGQEMAYWRNQYRKNRPVPPMELHVFPKPPANNQFGEFNDALFNGLDSQQRLPDLPGDVPARSSSGGSAASEGLVVPPPPPGMLRCAAPPVNAPAASGAAVAAGIARPAGISAGEYFYPIEQLVFGGEYPDIDKPEVYRLMPKDVISVLVRDHQEFSGQLEIQPDGTVRIPNTTDPIRLRGLTVDEAAEEVRRHLSVFIRGECVVRIQANRARGGYYFVFGDVLQPGRFPMGMEAIRLSDAVLAANWEANPLRRDADGDELGPSFPAASPRGRFIAPRSADLARVMLITPHRSQPVRTVHDVRSAMLGITGNDPVVRPGQIIVVPSLNPERNGELGLGMPPLAAPPEARMSGQGFSGATAPARLPEVTPPARTPDRQSPPPVSQVQSNMINAFEVQHNTEVMPIEEDEDICEVTESAAVVSVQTTPRVGGAVSGGRRLGRKMPEKRRFSAAEGTAGWKKGL